MKFVTKYSGKVTDDTIKGTITTDVDGKENKQELGSQARPARRRTEPDRSGRI